MTDLNNVDEVVLQVRHLRVYQRSHLFVILTVAIVKIM